MTAPTTALQVSFGTRNEGILLARKHIKSQTHSSPHKLTAAQYGYGYYCTHQTHTKLFWNSVGHASLSRSVKHQYQNKMGDKQDHSRTHLRWSILRIVTEPLLQRLQSCHIKITLALRLGRTNTESKDKSDCTFLHLHLGCCKYTVYSAICNKIYMYLNVASVKCSTEL